MPASTATVMLALKPDPGHVRLVRLVAAALGRLNGIGEEVLDDVRLATGEACARAVAAHLHHGVEHAVEVELSGGDGLDVVVRDFVPFRGAWEAAAAAEHEAQPDGMLALPEAIGLIEGVSDEVTVATSDAGTTVVMRWRRA